VLTNVNMRNDGMLNLVYLWLILFKMKMLVHVFTLLIHLNCDILNLYILISVFNIYQFFDTCVAHDYQLRKYMLY